MLLKHFKLIYNFSLKDCGAIIEVDDINDRGSIEKPTGYYGENCTWIIKSRDLGKRLKLIFGEYNAPSWMYDEFECSKGVQVLFSDQNFLFLLIHYLRLFNINKHFERQIIFQRNIGFRLSVI